ncbi:MAG: GNAT family N-acetyltransferase [Clostridia bacterium]|nr:GNAT family N-acetyltransferase [Clostridia bacterium]
MWKGRKIVMRQPQIKDAAILQKWYMDKEFRQMYDAYSSISLYNILQEIRESGTFDDPNVTRVNFIVTQKRDDLPIGVASIRNINRQNGNAEIVFGIGEKDKRLAGYGVDMMIVLLDIIFYHLDFEKCYLLVHDNNELGLNSAVNFGFKAEGRLRKHSFIEGKYVDLWILGLLKEEYEELPIVPKWKARK